METDQFTDATTSLIVNEGKDPNWNGLANLIAQQVRKEVADRPDEAEDNQLVASVIAMLFNNIIFYLYRNAPEGRRYAVGIQHGQGAKEGAVKVSLTLVTDDLEKLKEIGLSSEDIDLAEVVSINIE